MKYPTDKYRQGDWAIPYRRQEPDRVEETSYQKEMAGVWCTITFVNDYGTTYYPWDCKPVDLTKEILKHNGFEEDDEDGTMVLVIDDDTEITWRGGYLEIDSKVADVESYNCLYVHQLQHFLTDCEIDKDIEL